MEKQYIFDAKVDRKPSGETVVVTRDPVIDKHFVRVGDDAEQYLDQRLRAAWQEANRLAMSKWAWSVKGHTKNIADTRRRLENDGFLPIPEHHKPGRP